jgi:predicted transcriptional regulator
MSEHEMLDKKELIELATDLTCAYLGANQVQITEVSSVMNSFFQVLIDLNKASSSIKNRLPVAPAVPISESVFDDYIVCLEDGKHLQMLKRHLSTVYKMSIEEYRERWNLPTDYPVVAPSYAKRRSEIAKSTGLGRSGRKNGKKVRFVDSKLGSAAVA